MIRQNISELFFACLFLCIAIGSHEACTPRAVAPQNDADAAPAYTDLCSRACAVLAAPEHRCPEAKGMGGRDCLATCQHDTPAIVFDLHPACVADATTDEQIRKCGVECKK